MPLGIGLPPPPRFGNREGPQTPADWSSVWRWLTQVYQVLTTAVSVPLAFALQQNRGRGGSSSSGAVAIYVDHTDRLANYSAASYAPGQILEESDTGYCYVGDGADWIWQSGVIRDSSPSLAGRPGWLTTTDAGALYKNTIFVRVWMWDGSGWHYNDGGVGAGAQVATSGPPPSGGLWAPCDGGVYAVALDNCTTSSFAASDTRAVAGDNPVIQGGPGGGPVLPSRATWETSAVTDDESTHTHSVSVANTATASGVGAGSDLVAAQTVNSGPGSAHHHALTDANAQLKTFGDTNGGMPQTVSMAWYMRQ